MKISTGCGGLIFLICIFFIGSASAQTTITVNATLPSDIPGAPNATLQQSAAFAWQEFIALNWPALPGQRDMADSSQKFGAGGGLLVWETFRSKVEIFNLTKQGTPPGYTPGGPDYGYKTSSPNYLYGTREIPSCPEQKQTPSPSWVNLDETTQIGLDQRNYRRNKQYEPAADPVRGQGQSRTIQLCGGE